MATQHPSLGHISHRAVDTQARAHAPGQGRQASPMDIDDLLEEIDYPQSKSDIVAAAVAHGCSHDIIRALEGLHERVYENRTEVHADLERTSPSEGRS